MRIDPRAPMRSTTGICFGLRGKLTTAIVVLSCRRDDPSRTLFVSHEWEQAHLDIDALALELRHVRETLRPVLTVGYYGGRDDEKVFKVFSVRLGQHIEPAPGDAIAPTQLLIDDVRTGKLKARPGALVLRDAKLAIWRDGTPDQTGIIAALRCASWGAQQYRQKPPRTAEQKNAAALKEQRRRMSNPF